MTGPAVWLLEASLIANQDIGQHIGQHTVIGSSAVLLARMILVPGPGAVRRTRCRLQLYNQPARERRRFALFAALAFEGTPRREHNTSEQGGQIVVSERQVSGRSSRSRPPPPDLSRKYQTQASHSASARSAQLYSPSHTAAPQDSSLPLHRRHRTRISGQCFPLYTW